MTTTKGAGLAEAITTVLNARDQRTAATRSRWHAGASPRSDDVDLSRTGLPGLPRKAEVEIRDQGRSSERVAGRRERRLASSGEASSCSPVERPWPLRRCIPRRSSRPFMHQARPAVYSARGSRARRATKPNPAAIAAQHRQGLQVRRARRPDRRGQCRPPPLATYGTDQPRSSARTRISRSSPSPTALASSSSSSARRPGRIRPLGVTSGAVWRRDLQHRRVTEQRKEKSSISRPTCYGLHGFFSPGRQHESGQLPRSQRTAAER